MLCTNRHSLFGGSWADSSSSCRAQKSWWRAELMSTVVVGDVYSLHVYVYVSASWKGPRMVPKTVTVRETFLGNALISRASKLQATHDLRRHSQCHIRCMHACTSENCWPRCWETTIYAGSGDTAPCYRTTILFDISAFLIESSWCTSKTTLILWLLHVGCESVLRPQVERMAGHCSSSSERDSCHQWL